MDSLEFDAVLDDRNMMQMTRQPSSSDNLAGKLGYLPLSHQPHYQNPQTFPSLSTTGFFRS